MKTLTALILIFTFSTTSATDYTSHPKGLQTEVCVEGVTTVVITGLLCKDLGFIINEVVVSHKDTWDQTSGYYGYYETFTPAGLAEMLIWMEGFKNLDSEKLQLVVRQMTEKCVSSWLAGNTQCTFIF